MPTLGSDNRFPKLLLVEAAAPATPDAGEVKIYAKTDGLVYAKDDAGTETALSNVSASGVATDAIWDAAGDLVVGSGANTAARLAIGSNDQVLTVVGGAVAWAAAAGGAGAFSGARAYDAGPLSLSNGSFTAVTLGSESYDTDTYHDTGSNTDRLVVPTDGKYRVSAGGRFSDSSGATEAHLLLHKNTNTGGPSNVLAASSFGPVAFSFWANLTWDGALVAGDYVKLEVYIDVASKTLIDYWFAIERLSDDT